MLKLCFLSLAAFLQLFSCFFYEGVEIVDDWTDKLLSILMFLPAAPSLFQSRVAVPVARVAFFL